MDWLRRHRNTIFLITISGFILGAFVGFGSYVFTKSPQDAAITVNGEKIPYKRYQKLYTQYLNNRKEKDQKLDAAKIKEIKQSVIQDIVREEVFFQESKKYGITIPDAELSAYIQQLPAFQKDGRFDPATYIRVLHYVFRTTPEEFEKDRRRELAIQMLQRLLSSTVKLTANEINQERSRILAFTKDPEERKKIMENPEAFLKELQNIQSNSVLNEWLTQVNNRLKVRVFLDKFERAPASSGEPQ